MNPNPKNTPVPRIKRSTHVATLRSEPQRDVPGWLATGISSRHCLTESRFGIPCQAVRHCLSNNCEALPEENPKPGMDPGTPCGSVLSVVMRGDARLKVAHGEPGAAAAPALARTGLRITIKIKIVNLRSQDLKIVNLSPRCISHNDRKPGTSTSIKCSIKTKEVAKSR